MKDFSQYLYKKVKIICTDGKEFSGQIRSFGGSVQGEEEDGIAEDYIDIYTGDNNYGVFRSEIKEIHE